MWLMWYPIPLQKYQLKDGTVVDHYKNFPSQANLFVFRAQLEKLGLHFRNAFRCLLPVVSQK